MSGPENPVGEMTREDVCENDQIGHEWECQRCGKESGGIGLDRARLRKAFIAAGIVWVLPADLFDEAVRVTASEYDRVAS